MNKTWTSSGKYDITLPISFSSITSYVAYRIFNLETTSTNSPTIRNLVVYKYTKSAIRVYDTASYPNMFLCVGY